MLRTLRLKNLALVTDLTLELQPGFNAVTGETGAGKSILIGALNLVLGERADRTLIRSGADYCSVEAVFDVSQLAAPLPAFLEHNGLEPCEEGQLVLKRTFTSAGTNRQFINGSPATLNLLGAIGEWLVDIHGPHDHQSLLHASKQLAILDAFGALHPLAQQFADLLRQRDALDAEKTALIVDEKTYAQQLDLLRFQVNEISAADLQPAQEDQIERAFQRANNAAKLLQLSQTALGLLSDDDNALLTLTGLLGRTLQELHRMDPTAAGLLAQQQQIANGLRDLQTGLARYADGVEVDPGRLRELEERLNRIHSLKRKYGSTLAEVIAYGEEARRKLRALEQREAELNRLNSELDRIDGEVSRVGRELSARRRQVIPQLCRAVTRLLADLGFAQSHFNIAMAGPEPDSPITSATLRGARLAGFDTIEFQFAPNPGEPPKPLRAIASSGELARVMLALKTALAAQDEIPVLVFDEVDANVGGMTANAVGEKLRQLSRRRQVICVTHLAPVAAAASAHYLVTKQVQAGRTISEICLLDRTGRVDELVRMLGGQGEAARRHAQAMLDERMDRTLGSSSA
jgi:DNA repair protein RecN (Recombination protein N)